MSLQCAITNWIFINVQSAFSLQRSLGISASEVMIGCDKAQLHRCDARKSIVVALSPVTFSEVRRNVSLIPQILVVDGLRDALFPQCVGTF